MAIQHFTSSPTLHFTSQENHMHGLFQFGSYLETIRRQAFPPVAPLGLLTGSQKRICFVSRLAASGRKQRWRKPMRCLCGSKERVSMLLTEERVPEVHDS